MNIIAAGRLRQVDNSEFLYIGNMADVITNETQLATRLVGVDASDITQFEIIRNDIKCKVSKVFSVLDFENSNISFFVSKFSSLQDNFTGFTGTSKLKSFAHYNSGNAVTDENFKGSGVKHLFFPNAKICAGYNSLSNLTDTKIYMPSVDTFQRIVSGSNNIVSSSSNLTIYKDPNVSYPFSVDNFVDILDTTTPNSVTDLSDVEIGGAYLRINFTEIANADFYELWIYDSGLDTFLFKSEITNNGYVTGLEENTNYQIKIATCDQYWNGSGFFEDENKRAFSKTINVTTTTTPVLYQNSVAYYKLNETSGDAIDVVNGYNGALFGGVTQGVAGKIGTAYSFNGIDGYMAIPYLNDVDGFSFSFWYKRKEPGTINLFTREDSGGTDWGINMFDNGSKVEFRVVTISNEPADNPVSKTISTQVDDWHHVVAIYSDINSELYLYFDGTLAQSISTNGNTLRGKGSEFAISKAITSINQTQFEFDEFAVYENLILTPTEISELYNNGNGTTI